MEKEIDILFENEGKINRKAKGNNNKYKYVKVKLKKICESLTFDNNYYKPQYTVKSVQSYINKEEKIQRILYSEISNYIFSLDYGQRATVAANLDVLLNYVLDDSKNNDNACVEVVLKLYDHCQLAIRQVENVQHVFYDGVEEIKDNLSNDIKNIEREYITILGIFASIVLAFVGGIVYSSSVLKYISEVSIYRLIFVVDLLAIVLLTVIYMLIAFIAEINGRNYYVFRIGTMYFICTLIAIVDFVAWLINAGMIPQFVIQYLPWC